MKKRFLSTLLAVCMVLTLLIIVPIITYASADDYYSGSGECGAQGDNVTWVLSNGVLRISGTGDMVDIPANRSAP